MIYMSSLGLLTVTDEIGGLTEGACLSCFRVKEKPELVYKKVYLKVFDFVSYLKDLRCYRNCTLPSQS